ncbi:MAG: AI-2E family transporter [Candidatus Ancillula sp.]|jgi:predicted PurR-regulated permease PerM|nr:AI-2E family transporter [Candidatus Ancillula sp.]
MKVDLGAVFPEKGSPKHPPLWFSRAILWVALAIIAFNAVVFAFTRLADLISVVLISAFLAFALEPGVNFLCDKFKWRKGATTLTCIFAGLGVIGAAVWLFGSIFIEQMINLFELLPGMYDDAKSFVSLHTGLVLPEAPDLMTEFLRQYSSDIGQQAMSFSIGMVALVVNLLAVVLIMYFICAEGTRFRQSVVSWFPKPRQKEIIRVWTITQVKISGFLGSRLILAIVSTVFVSVVCLIMQVPSWLPLGIFMGIIGQFVPTVGVYLGAALPILVTFGSRGLVDALIMLVILTIYQNLENIILMPKVSEDALDLNPAVAFISVLAFGYIFGALGAFLALPVVATFATVFRLTAKRYDIIDVEEEIAVERALLKTMRDEREAQLKERKADKKKAKALDSEGKSKEENEY